MLYLNLSAPAETSPDANSPRGVAHSRRAGGQRRRLLAPLLLLLLTVALIPAARGQLTAPTPAADEAAGPREIDDLAVIRRDSGGYTVFAVDTEMDAIFYGFVEPGEGTAAVGWSTFERLEVSGEKAPRHPTALAAHGDTLYAADYRDDAVYAITINASGGRLTGGSRLLLGESKVRKPVSLDVSPDGILAVAQDGIEVLLINPATPDAPIKLPGFIDEPTRLQFLPSAGKPEFPNLLVLDSENEKSEAKDDSLGRMVLFEYNAPTGKTGGPGLYTRRLLRLPADVNSRLKPEKDRDLDAAYAGDCLYVTDSKNWLAYASPVPPGARWVFSPPRARQMLFPGVNELRPGRLRASGQRLFVSDPKNRKVWTVSLRSMTIKMDVSALEANEAAADLYSRLGKEGQLPKREYNAPLRGGTENLVNILRDEKVLATAEGLSVSGDSTPFQPRASTTATLLGSLLCDINKEEKYGWKCAAGTNSQGASGAASLFYKVGSGNSFAIPALELERVAGTSRLVLQGRTTLRAELERRLKGTDALSHISTGLLMELSKDYYRTLEHELTRGGYMLTSAPTPSAPQIAPGAVLQINAGQEQLISAGDCPAWAGLESGVASKPFKSLSQPLRLQALSVEYLPRRAPGADPHVLNERAVQDELKKRGVTKIEAVFEDPAEMRAARGALTGAPPACWGSVALPRAYLAVDVVRVSGMKYRLRGADDTMVALTEADLRRWGLDGVPDSTGEWSVVVAGPYTLGYRALRWDGKPLFASPPAPEELDTEVEARLVTDPQMIKPKSGQDVWEKTSGTFTFPSYRWEIRLQVDPTLAVSDSSLRAWADKFKDRVTVTLQGESRQTRQGVTSQTAASPALAPPPPATIDDVAANRRELFRVISYPRLEPEETEGITIGLLEQEGSVEVSHPDFAWQEVAPENCDDTRHKCYELVWQRPFEEGEAPSSRIRAAVNKAAERVVYTAEEIAPTYNAFWKKNHGTHIVGLLASNNDLVPGLLPSAQIRYFQVDAQSPNLTEQLNKPMGNALQVFNVSQHFDGALFPKGKLTDPTADIGGKLYVVAAGNGLPPPPDDRTEGADLNELKAAEVPIPVAWLSEIDNLLVVGAINMERKLVRRGEKGYRFNLGSNYVHLVAPGFDIYSSTETRSYAPASGTSQAAPLVAATAALLYKVKSDSHFSLLKGRLIYTADWNGRDLEERKRWPEADNYLWRVWGGSLNAGRAYKHLDENVFEYDQGNGERVRAIELPDNIKLPMTITNAGRGTAHFVEQPRKPRDTRNPTVKPEESTIDFSQVLRLTQLPDKTYRIIFLEKITRRMRIIMNARISGKFNYRNYKVLQGDRFVWFRPVPVKDSEMFFSEIVDYVAKYGAMSPNINF